MTSAPAAPLSRPEWRHWHPVALERELGLRPKQVSLLGQDLVLFRTASGALGALLDACPHRRMSLASGHVAGECVVCPYHGFRFDPAGRGASPGTPQMRLDALALEVRAAWGAIWVRRAGADTAMPELDRPGRYFAGVMAHTVQSPLEPLVDNFCEVEHTPTTHALFGYRDGSLESIAVDVTTTPDSVRVLNVGPQKQIPWLVERAFGVRSGDTFTDDWVVRFSPVHILYDQSWADPATGAARADSVHPAVVFTPTEADETRIFTFVWTNRAPWGRGGLDLLLQPVLRAIVAREVRLDRAMVERLADQDPDLRGTRLGRFDAALREHRKRIAALYRA
ncbi:MAG: Rieske 2Fe-2S domain-containing protein [Myxococcota bacterium]